MALKNRLGVINWTLEDDTITLAATPMNQKSLEDATGVGFFDYLNKLDTMSSNPFVILATVFHHCQVGSDYSVDEIYSAFFGDMSAYKGNYEAQQSKFINHLMGNQESQIIADAQKGEEKKVKN